MKIKIILQALTGYIGSSESPEKISTRFIGVSMGAITFLAPFVASLLGVGVESIVAQVQPIGYLIAVVWWLVGAIKACWLALKASPTLGAFLK
jgi:hypothetical protein